MITAKFNTAKFNKEMNNIVKYSAGFVDGVQKGKTVFFQSLGAMTVEGLKEYIDSNAGVNPAALQHVYEWYKTGISSARLFEVDYTISNLGLSFKSNFTQSSSIKAGSRTPFYNKAEIMENGMSVRIRPKNSPVLAFEIDGETVFTSNEVTVKNPGGREAVGGFQNVFDQFFQKYFTQAFLRSSGIYDYIENPIIYKKDFNSGSRKGKSQGVKTGYTWITNAKIGVDNG